jgi:hypothetical protein
MYLQGIACGEGRAGKTEHYQQKNCQNDIPS